MYQPNHPLSLSLPPVIARPVEALIRLNKVKDIYNSENKTGDFDGFLQAMLEAIGCNIAIEGELDVPAEGPLVIVANHPIGGPEGVLLTQLLIKARPDLKVLTNRILAQIPEFENIFLGAEIIKGKATQKNLASIKKATIHVKNGGALLVFPAGLVSRFNLKKLRIQDSDWNSFAATIIKRYNATCLPIHIGARNSNLFYIMSSIHRHFGTIMLPNEFSNKQGKTIKVTYGDLIQPAELKDFESAEEINDYLRLNTVLLGSKAIHTPTAGEQAPLTTIAPDHDLIDTDLEGMQDYKLFEQEQFQVYCTPYEKMGTLMTCIGIAREVAFRAVGMGSGKDIDLGKYDYYYNHLFVWDIEKRAIVGGYRIGQVDKILEKHGVKGLYTRSVYKFKQTELKNIENSLEVGRSFISPDYQRMPVSLSILWRGIGAYMAQNPDYHTLFGSVSISRELSNNTRALISEVLLKVSGVTSDQIASRVKPIKPMRLRRKVWDEAMLKTLSSVSLINHVIGRSDYGKSIPILLRQYLALNGKIACFAANPANDNSWDALIIVDLRESPEKYVRRYLGEAADDFAEKWSLEWAKDTKVLS